MRENFGDLACDVEEGKKENRSLGMWKWDYAKFLDRYQSEDIYMVNSLRGKLLGMYCTNFPNKIDWNWLVNLITAGPSFSKMSIGSLVPSLQCSGMLRHVTFTTKLTLSISHQWHSFVDDYFMLKGTAFYCRKIKLVSQNEKIIFFKIYLKNLLWRHWIVTSQRFIC